MMVLRCPTFLVLASLKSMSTRVFLSLGDVVHFETFEIVDERLLYVIVLEQHCFLGLVCVGNLSLDKLRVCVAS